jgi:hypothetical protein
MSTPSVETGYTPTPAPAGELTRLTSYLAGRFQRQRTDLAALLSESPDSKWELVKLSQRALAFRHELAGWHALAQRLYRGHYADQFNLAHEQREQALKSEGPTLRASADLIRADADQASAALREAVDLISATRDDMSSVVSWAQTLIRSLLDEEISGEAAGVPDADDAIYEAPLAAALRP